MQMTFKGASILIILRVCVCMMGFISIPISLSKHQLSCGGWSFSHKQALFTWAVRSFVLNKTSDWNLPVSEEVISCWQTHVAGKVGAFLSKLNQWFTSSGASRYRPKTECILLLYGGSLYQEYPYRFKDVYVHRWKPGFIIHFPYWHQIQEED